MIFFNNAKLLLFLICFMGSFQALQSFCCCYDDAIIDTRPKTTQQTSNQNFSVAAAIAQNQKNNQRIAEQQKSNLEDSLNSQNSITAANKTTSFKRSDLASIIAQNKKKHERIAEQQRFNQEESLNSQNLATQANLIESFNDVKTATQQNSGSKDQPYTEAGLFSSYNQEAAIDISMPQIPNNSKNGTSEENSLGLVQKENAFSSNQSYLTQNANNLALHSKADFVEREMSELRLPSPAIQSNNMANNNNSLATSNKQTNYLNQSVESIPNDENQDNDSGFDCISRDQKTPELVGLIRPQTAKGARSPNQAIKGRVFSTNDLPSPILSTQGSAQLESNLPHTIEENFNDINQI